MSLGMDDRDGFIWLDGKLVPWRDSRMHVLTHALHYGSAVFEGERIYDGRVFRLAAHSQRLINSARLLDYEIPWTRDRDRGGDARRDQGQQPAGRLRAADRLARLGGDGRVGHRHHRAPRHRPVGAGGAAVGAGARCRHQRHHGQVSPPVGRLRARPCQGGGPLPDLRHREGQGTQGRLRRCVDARLEGRPRQIDRRQHLPGDRRHAGDADTRELFGRHHAARRHGPGEEARLVRRGAHGQAAGAWRRRARCSCAAPRPRSCRWARSTGIITRPARSPAP